MSKKYKKTKSSPRVKQKHDKVKWRKLRFDTGITRKYSLVILDHVIRKLAAPQRNGRHTSLIMSLYKSGDLYGVANYTFEYSFDDSAEDLIVARQIQAFFSKNTWAVGDDLDPALNCLETLLRTERQNFETNNRLYVNPHPENQDVASVILLAQRKIAEILNGTEKEPLADLDLFSKNFSFGPGSNTSVKPDRVSPRGKLSSGLVFLPEMQHIVHDFIKMCPDWAELHTSFETISVYSDGSSYGTLKYRTGYGRAAMVEKNFKTHRFILTGTVIAGIFQRIIGTEMAARLRKNTGIDLTFGKERNMYLAMRSSITNQDATIDMENASNLIAVMAVCTMFPSNWVEMMSTFRDSKMDINSLARRAGLKTKFDPVELHMFSSMGNGYTFEMESILFYSIAHACCSYLGLSSSEIGIVGDDLILPREASSLCIACLNFLGFTINDKKSFVDGPFRESCGGDYFLGTDIRPFYLKSEISARQLFLLHNFFIRTGRWDVAGVVLKYIPRRFHIFGPDGYGDGHLLGEWNPRTNREKRRSGHEITSFDTFQAVSKKFTNWNAYYENIYMRYAVSHSNRDEVVDHDVVKGNQGYQKVSVETLATCIFARKTESSWTPSNASLCQNYADSVGPEH